MVKDLQSHLATEYISLMMEDDGTKPLHNRNVDENEASQWIDAFKNIDNLRGGN